MDNNTDKFETISLSDEKKHYCVQNFDQLKSILMSELGEDDDDLREIIEELIQEGSISMKTVHASELGNKFSFNVPQKNGDVNSVIFDFIEKTNKD